MSAHPDRIIKDGEEYRLAAERPGWLVYENDEHVILVGRQEAVTLAVTDANPMTPSWHSGVAP